MDFELLTLTGTKFSGKIAEVSLKSANGDIGIMPGHEPMTTIVLAGPVMIHTADGKEELFAAFGGLLEVAGSHARLLADEADHADDLVQADIQSALEKAQRMKSEAKDKHELSQAQELIDRHEVRLGVAKLHRRRPRG